MGEIFPSSMEIFAVSQRPALKSSFKGNAPQLELFRGHRPALGALSRALPRSWGCFKRSHVRGAAPRERGIFSLIRRFIEIISLILAFAPHKGLNKGSNQDFSLTKNQNHQKQLGSAGGALVFGSYL